MSEEVKSARCPSCGAPSPDGELCQRCEGRTSGLNRPSTIPSASVGRASSSSSILLEGKYRLLEEIGRGGMGTVFRAMDESLDRHVAIKFLLPELQADPVLPERFRREARAMASVRNENVLQIFSFGTYGSTSFFVMEFIEGLTAEQLLVSTQERNVFFPLDEALRILYQSATGLGAVHRAGVVHRDVKPGNIMVEGETRRAVIMDFGIGKRYMPGDKRRTQAPSGTPAYMAPEVVSGQEIKPDQDHLSDIYALGITAFELLTSTLPFDADSWVDVCVKHVTEPAPVPSTLRRGITPELDEIILKCLAKAPAERYQTCDEFLTALRPLVVPDATKTPTPFPHDSGAYPRVQPTPSRKTNTEIARRARVVVADQDASCRNLFYQNVQDVFPGCRFQAAKTNTKALELALASPPLLVVAPLDDSDLNGLELAATLRSQLEMNNTHIVLTADRITAGERKMLQGMGVFKILLKPVAKVDMQELLAEVADRAEAYVKPSQSRSS